MMVREKIKSPWRRVGRFVLQTVLPFAVLLLALDVVAFRLRVRLVIDAARSFNKRITNPAMMKLAGHRYWCAAVIRHTGRRSGREYATPVWAQPAEENFLIPLPYGENVDWLRNVLAAGRAAVEAQRESYIVVEPEVVDRADAEPFVSTRARLLFRLFGIERYLKVKRLSEIRVEAAVA